MKTQSTQTPANAGTLYRRLLAALAFFALTASGLSATDWIRLPVLPIPSSASIWFHPKPYSGSPPSGSVDFPSLFQDDAPWQRAMAKTQVFGLYAGWIAAASPQTLQQVVAFLNAHNMAIEIEAPALQALATCGSGIEGYVPYGQSLHDFTLAYLGRLKAFGAQQIIIKVD
jgi:hypothetical protein